MSFVGSTIGHIRIEALIGAGGMGEVYRGFHEKLERRVLRPLVEEVPDELALILLGREAEARPAAERLWSQGFRGRELQGLLQ